MPRKRRLAVIDTLLALLVTLAAAYLIHAAIPYPGAPGPSIATLGIVSIAALGALVVAASIGLAAGSLDRISRVAVHFGSIAIIAFAVQRYYTGRIGDVYWPPHGADISASRLAKLFPAERAEWAARVALHAVTRPGVARGQFIPADWPMPPDVEIAIDSTPSAVRAWARAGREVACLASSLEKVAKSADRECPDSGTAPSSLVFSRPRREVSVRPVTPAKVSGGSWIQYRNVPERVGRASPAVGGRRGWRTQTEGPVRASVSVVGKFVLVGGHGTGALTALDLADGTVVWRTRLPNWIHQDPVSNGRHVVVGFGNTWPSFAGRAPSGVAVYELATGRHLWTEFDESSVMTSAVIVDTSVVYATAAGVLRKRSITSGKLIDRSQLPGGVIMAPLALAGRTLFAALDRSSVCAIRVSDLSEIWCRRFPHLRMLGHAAAAVDSRQVVVSGLTTLLSVPVHDIGKMQPAFLAKLVKRTLAPPGDAAISGQTFLSLDRASGETRWHAPMFPAVAEVSGHISGTAVLSGRTAVIILPVADRIVAFDSESGTVKWSAPGHDSRGPPLVLVGRVILAGGDGVIEVRDVASGRLVCRMRRSSGWDRAGPVEAGGVVVFANVKGEIEAIPAPDLLRCYDARATRPLNVTAVVRAIGGG